MMIWLNLTNFGWGVENVEKEITHDGNNLITPHKCSSTEVLQNMQLCYVSFKGSVRGPQRFFVYY